MIIAVAAGAATAQSWLSTERYTYINKTADQSDAAATQYSIRAARLRTGIDFAVIMLPSLPAGETIQSEAVRLFREEKLGKQTGWRAVLILYVEQPSAMKIEVSQNLEGEITDAMAGVFERAARAGMIKGRRADFLSETIITLGMEGRAQQDVDPVSVSPALTSLSSRYSAGGGVVGRGYDDAASQALHEIAPLPLDMAASYLPADTPDGSLQIYLRSLKDGIGDPGLPVLSQNSKLYRTEWPQTRGALFRTYLYDQRSLPYRLIQREGLAVVLFRTGNAALPVILKQRGHGAWLVDEPLSMALFARFEDTPDIFIKFPIPFLQPVLAAGLVSMRTDMPDAAPVGKAVLEADDGIAKLAVAEKTYGEKRSPDATLALAEMLYFNFYWVEAAIPLYEQSIQSMNDQHLENRSRAYRWRLLDAYMTTSRIDKYLSEWDAIACAYPNDPWIAHNAWYIARNYDFAQWHWGRAMHDLQITPDSWSIHAAVTWHMFKACTLMTD